MLGVTGHCSVVGEDLQCWQDVGWEAVVLLPGHQSLGGEQLQCSCVCVCVYSYHCIFVSFFPFCLSK